LTYGTTLSGPSGWIAPKNRVLATFSTCSSDM
jgi:hypothetical protein